MVDDVAVGSWGADSSIGRVRRFNEDAWGELANRLFVVADGMGGEAGGATASAEAVASLMRVAGQSFAQPDPGDSQWVSVMREVNQDVHARMVARRTPSGGTTVVALRFGDTAVSVAHIGDSRAYHLSRSSDQLRRITDDHSVAEELKAAGQSVEAYHNNVGRSDALTRYIGGGRAFAPSEQVIAVEAGDRILLCTDGVHGQLSESTMVATLKAGSCRDSARALVRQADEAGGRDNSTALVVETVAR